jgi:hypothetical protein
MCARLCVGAPARAREQCSEAATARLPTQEHIGRERQNRPPIRSRCPQPLHPPPVGRQALQTAVISGRADGRVHTSSASALYEMRRPSAPSATQSITRHRSRRRLFHGHRRSAHGGYGARLTRHGRLGGLRRGNRHYERRGAGIAPATEGALAEYTRPCVLGWVGFCVRRAELWRASSYSSRAAQPPCSSCGSTPLSPRF